MEIDRKIHRPLLSVKRVRKLERGLLAASHYPITRSLLVGQTLPTSQPTKFASQPRLQMSTCGSKFRHVTPR